MMQQGETGRMRLQDGRGGQRNLIWGTGCHGSAVVKAEHHELTQAIGQHICERTSVQE